MNNVTSIGMTHQQAFNRMTKEDLSKLRLVRFFVAIGGAKSLELLITDPADFWANRWGYMCWSDRCWVAQFVVLPADYYLSGNWSYLDDGAKGWIANKTQQAARRAALKILAHDAKVGAA